MAAHEVIVVKGIRVIPIASIDCGSGLAGQPNTWECPFRGQGCRSICTEHRVTSHGHGTAFVAEEKYPEYLTWLLTK